MVTLTSSFHWSIGRKPDWRVGSRGNGKSVIGESKRRQRFWRVFLWRGIGKWNNGWMGVVMWAQEKILLFFLCVHARVGFFCLFVFTLGDNRASLSDGGINVARRGKFIARTVDNCRSKFFGYSSEEGPVYKWRTWLSSSSCSSLKCRRQRMWISNSTYIGTFS